MLGTIGRLMVALLPHSSITMGVYGSVATKPPPLAPWVEATAPVDVGGIASST